MCSLHNIIRYGKLFSSLEDVSCYLEFASESDAEQWGDRNYADWGTKYKRTMRIAKEIGRYTVTYPFATIEQYCGYDFRQINGYLRGYCDDTLSDVYREMSHILTILISDAPPIPNDIVVYRLVCDAFADYLYKQNKSGMAAIEAGFMSTSLLNRITEQDEPYAQHKNLLKIYVPKGTPGVYVNTVAKRSEQEILIAPNRFLTMVKYPYKGNDDKTIIECRLLNMECALL